ncbi:MAG TPA: hypothetical protein PLB79_04835 [Thermotogota bacterium]|jgi:hypothetical protein|nr:hypothetical protein [Thermotogota bacterium]NLH19496.1 hypothetical protein [Thermotogaceae bacterium]OQC32411.1 MAG: hypothetical protein BWX67_00479 [Thermotogota bacterium ADurb.Bin062]HNW47060.1 hypothetical protein [Thermotogota bacterium]HNY81639.1 hypothetical protein [Thermotogota bacterium]
MKKAALNLPAILKMICTLAALVVEEPGKGAEKKQKAIQLVHEFILSMGIHIPKAVLDLVLPPMIDQVVGILNQTVWLTPTTLVR